MYERFFNLRERPFSLSPDPDYLYPSRNHTEALSYLRYGLEGHAGFIVLTGEIGSGKTTLLQTVLRGLDRQTSVSRIVNTLLDPRELVDAVLLDFGLEARGHESKPHLLRELARFLVAERRASRLALLVIDEAQNLGLATLEEVRMLSNLETEKSKLLQIVLVGQPSLRESLARPELQQLRQRVAVSYHLRALDAADTAAYLRHRLRRASVGAPLEFPPAVSDLVHRHSQGLPRTINLIADAILLFAYGDSQRAIAAPLAQEAINELEATGVIAPLGVGAGVEDRPLTDGAAVDVDTPTSSPVVRTPEIEEDRPVLLTSRPAATEFQRAEQPRALHERSVVRAVVPARRSAPAGHRADERTPSRTVAAIAATLLAGVAVTALALAGVSPMRTASRAVDDITALPAESPTASTAAPQAVSTSTFAARPARPVPTEPASFSVRATTPIDTRRTTQSSPSLSAPARATASADSRETVAGPSGAPSNRGASLNSLTGSRRVPSGPGATSGQAAVSPSRPANEPIPVGRPLIPPVSSNAAAATLPPFAPAPLRSATPTPPPVELAPIGESVLPAAAVSAAVAPARPAVPEDTSVRAVLNQYRSAYNRLDAAAAQTVWPSVDARALSRAFDQLQSQELDFSGCRISISADRAVALCGGNARYVPAVGAQRVRSESRQWTFDLRKADDRWTIAAVEVR